MSDDNNNNNNDNNSQGFSDPGDWVCENDGDSSSYSYSNDDDDEPKDSEAPSNEGGDWEDTAALDFAENDDDDRKLPAVELELPSELLLNDNHDNKDDDEKKDESFSFSFSFPDQNEESSDHNNNNNNKPLPYAAASAASASWNSESWSHLDNKSSSSSTPANSNNKSLLWGSTVAASSYTYPPPSGSSSNASIVSSSTFDILDVDGYSLKQCRLDGYLNDPEAVFCGGCGAALVANPHLDADLQIALHLQQQEDERMQHQHLAEQPLFQQAQVWSQQVAQRVEEEAQQPRCSDLMQVSCHAVPVGDRVLTAARFLEVARQRLDGCGRQNGGLLAAAPLRLAYRVTPNAPKTVRAMHKGEYYDNNTTAGNTKVVVCDTVEDSKHFAKHCFYNTTSTSTHRTTMPVISEEEEDESSDNNHLSGGWRAWIVAVAPGVLLASEDDDDGDNPNVFVSETRRDMALRHSSGHVHVQRKKPLGGGANKDETTYRATAVYGSDATLPLASLEFHHHPNNGMVDADAAVQAVADRLYNALEQVCADFWIDVGLVTTPPQDTTTTTPLAMIPEGLVSSEEFREQERLLEEHQKQHRWAQEQDPEGNTDHNNNKDAAVIVLDDALPPGWTRYYDATLKQDYYYHHVRGVTTWDREEALAGFGTAQDDPLVAFHRQSQVVAPAVVQIGRWDEATGRVERVGCGFVCHKKFGLIATAASNLALETNALRLSSSGNTQQQEQHCKIVIGVNQRWRYLAVLWVDDLDNHVDACILRITDRFTNPISNLSLTRYLCTTPLATEEEPLAKLQLLAHEEEEEEGNNNNAPRKVQIFGYRHQTPQKAKNDPNEEQEEGSVSSALDSASGILSEPTAAVLDKEEEEDPEDNGHPFFFFAGGSPLVDSEGYAVGMLSRQNPHDPRRLYLVSARQLKSLVYHARALVVRTARARLPQSH